MLHAREVPAPRAPLPQMDAELRPNTESVTVRLVSETEPSFVTRKL